MRRVSVALAVLAAVVLTAGTTAFAAWGPPGSGTGSGAGTLVGFATSRSATATSGTAVTVTWNAPGGPSAIPTSYVVRRVAPTTTTVCTATPPTFTCNDTGLTPGVTYTYTIEARVGTKWSSGQSPGVSATTLNPNFLVTLVPTGTKTAGTNFNVKLTATTDGVTTDPSYGGSHAITFSGPGPSPNGGAPTYPGAVTFTAGVGTASVNLKLAETVALVATDGGRSGSVLVTVNAGAAKSLTYTNSSADCSGGSVAVGWAGTWTSKVTVLDNFGNPTIAGSPMTITLARSPAGGTLTPASLNVLSGQSETSAALSYTRPWWFTSYTVTASKSGLTSAACAVNIW